MATNNPECNHLEEDRAFGHYEGESKITWCTKCFAVFKDGEPT